MPEQRVQSLFRSWRAFAIEDREHAGAKALAYTSPHTPVFAKKMCEFVRDREPLFGIYIGAINEGNAVTAPRHETGTQWAVRARKLTHHAAFLQPLQRGANAEPRQQHNRQRHRSCDWPPEIPRKRLNLSSPC